MQILCRYSGLQLARYKHFRGLEIADVHPIFSLKPRILWRLADSFYVERTTSEERHLLFLAVAHNTGLLRFTVPAVPTDTTILSCWDHLKNIAGWIEQLQAPGVHFPSYVVRSDTRTMHNFKEWLKALDAIRRDFYEGQAKQEHKARMISLESKLERMILAQITEKQRGINSIMANWALEVSEAPLATRAHWTKILLTSRDRVYTLNPDDIKALITHLEENLPHGSISANAVMRRVRELLEQQADGLGLYEILDDSTSDDANDSNSDNSIKETANIPAALSAVAGAPANEPQPHHYTSRVSYLVARAQWNLAQNAFAHAASNVTREDKKEAQ